MDAGISYLAVLCAAVVSYIIGAVWYSPAGFGKQWRHMAGLTKEGMRSMPLTATQAMIIGFFTTLLFSYVLAHFALYLHANSFSAGLQLGFWIWLGFIATTLAGSWLWEGKPFKLFLFNSVYQFVSIEAMMLVLVLWQ